MPRDTAGLVIICAARARSSGAVSILIHTCQAPLSLCCDGVALPPAHNSTGRVADRARTSANIRAPLFCRSFAGTLPDDTRSTATASGALSTATRSRRLMVSGVPAIKAGILGTAPTTSSRTRQAARMGASASNRDKKLSDAATPPRSPLRVISTALS